jgi:hypothetical protein
MRFPLRTVRWGEPDPGHVLAVQTAPREPAYLPASLATLDAAGLARWCGPRFIVADGYVPEAPGWHIEPSPTREGQARTFFRLMRLAAAVPGFTTLTLFEDDIALARNALDYIARVRIDDDLVFLAWHNTNVTLPWGVRPPSLVDVPVIRYRSNVAVTFPARAVLALLDSDALRAWERTQGADILTWGVFPQGRCGIHYPALVQHVGDVSVLGNPIVRRDLHFVGEAADAMQLMGGPT